MNNLKDLIGPKYEDLVKCDFIKDLEDILSADSFINIDVEDIKNICEGEIVGSVSILTSDLSDEFVMNRISDKCASDCLLDITSNKDLTLQEIELIVSKIKKLGNAKTNVIIGTGIDKNMNSTYKIQALFSSK